MSDPTVEVKSSARALFDMRALSANLLGGRVAGPPGVRFAAHLAWALHDEAMAIVGSRQTDVAEALKNIEAIDNILGTVEGARGTRSVPPGTPDDPSRAGGAHAPPPHLERPVHTMTCDRCDPFEGIRIQLPEDLTRAIRRCRELVTSGGLVPSDYWPPGTTRWSDVAWADVREEGPWDDVVQYFFACPHCAQLFSLNAATYRGSGGRFDRHEAGA